MNELHHLAIIMDGNGRWAKTKSLARIKGHEAGAKVVETVSEFCIKNGIANLTLYAFSTENWKRPESEVNFLLNLLKKFIIKKREIFIKNEINFKAIGDISVFSQDLQSEISALQNLTATYKKLNFNLALNYGSRDEIIRAAKKVIQKGDELNEQNLSANLDSANSGDVDLLIRTGGEIRLSNFMLWQASYAEFAFTNTFWPDFSEDELAEIVENFKIKNRRFGGL
ncbi:MULTISPECIES: polyprenyl diphosphate synthase [Campylobacter]|uniref:polyprenyl diphosphate synthase n=1 Tax=Campylobacter TaxID=194 RepID=UPI0023F50F9C|nr:MULTISPECIES: polyprenyl diphosphate synthase [Campylobacter]MCI6642205.1 polyprenyl diphosphate synthase [Campylobacter sp.]MDD7422316.1 polyprenyl diphosphate synthase [Campylobacter hominis]MDY3116739.1 polyprenyl diphosphate synthase [Campylobacter hominis]